LAAFIDRPLDSHNGDSMGAVYDRLTAETTQNSTVAGAVANGFRTYEATLQGQSLAISGVNIDEEAIKMISYQRAFQASAKYISTVSELMEVLVNL
jgi:flagellar hook-associated protein 1 FlgK